MVNEYEADELADDEADEKRIAIAQKSAEKKAEAAMNKRRKSRVFNSYKPAGGQFQNTRQPFRADNVNYVQPPTQSQRVGGGRLGPCFGCHEYGHLRSSCPKVVQGSVYPFVSEADSNSVCDSLDIVCDEHVEDVVALLEDECDWTLEEALEGLNELTVVKGRLKEHYDYWCEVLHAPEHTSYSKGGLFFIFNEQASFILQG